jgi:hypothetical protein
MDGKRFLRLSMIFGTLFGACGAAVAAPPWGDLIASKTVQAEQGKEYPLSEQNGPWMIMTSSFSGDGAEKQAQDLVYELRKRYKLPAYTYKGHFDLGEAQGRGIDEFGNAKKFQYAKYKDSKDREKARRPELTEIAVLVGNYQSPEDPDAQKTLQKIKFTAPECLEIKEGVKTNQSLVGLRRLISETVGGDQKKKGPMGHAFITPNPVLPSEFFSQRKGVDPVIVALNEGVPYSLLDCPGKYTVQVATFKGQVIIKQDEIKAIQNGDKEMKGELAKAAEKADKLTKALRVKGYEAYQFHDHYASIVTVGSFDSVGTPRADGKTEINPEIHKIMNTFGAKPTTLPGQTTPVTPLRTLVGIPFDIQSIPVEVPKRSFSTAMRNRDTE